MATLYDAAEVERFRRSWRLDPHRLRRLRHAFLRDRRPPDAALLELPLDARRDFARHFEFHCLALAGREDSATDGASKLVFRAPDGLSLATVILRAPSGRTTRCVSTQVGCAAGCRFCATAARGRRRNREPAEIVDQLAGANQLLRDEGRQIRNLVFMGMGEPFHTEAHLHAAVRLLQQADYFYLPPRRTFVSTVGVPDAMRRWAAQFSGSPLGLSLHSARAEVRAQLIPLARHHSLAALRDALDDVVRLQQRPVLIEYLMLRELTDTAADAAALIDYLQGLRCHLNLIPFNPIDTAPDLQTTLRPERDRFACRLREAGLTVTIRYSQGADVTAACGQLAGRSG